MKTGIILYVTGNEPDDFSGNSKKIIEKLHLGADSVELISNWSGHFDIHEAARALVVKGMERIICMMAGFTSSGAIELTGRNLRLCG